MGKRQIAKAAVLDWSYISEEEGYGIECEYTDGTRVRVFIGTFEQSDKAACEATVRGEEFIDELRNELGTDLSKPDLAGAKH